MISPSLNHVFVIVHGVLLVFYGASCLMCQCHGCLSRVLGVSRLQNVPASRKIQGGLTCDLQASLCVDALIEGNDVAMMLVAVKGHLKVVVYQGESLSSYHLTVLVCLSVCPSLMSVFLLSRSQTMLLIYSHQQYVSVFASRRGKSEGRRAALLACLYTPFQPPLSLLKRSSNHPSIMHLMKGYHAEPFLKHSGKRKKKEKKKRKTRKQSMLSEGEVEQLPSVKVIILLWKGS